MTDLKLSFEFLAATRLPMSTLLMVGAAASVGIVLWSFAHWRAAVKTAFVVALIEGALRKWAFPQGQELVYFLKDVFLFGAYVKFFLAPDPEIRAWRLKLPTFTILLLCLIISMSALNPNINSAILSLYGLKIYFYYLPLVFLMPFVFRNEAELNRQLTWYLWLAIPICLLGLVQWRAGADSFLNVYAQQEAMEASGSGISGFGFGDKARITGTFSYITGHTTFVIFFTTLAIVMLSVAQTRWKWLIVGFVIPLLIVNGLMSGSRAVIYVGCLLVAGFALPAFAGKIGDRTNFRSLLVIAGMMGAAASAYLFYEAFFYMSLRTRASEDTLYDRAVVHPLSALEAGLEDGGITGLGIGMTHPASAAIRRVLQLPPPEKIAPVYDAEIGQVLVELGPVGFACWYGLRLLIVFYAWLGYRNSGPNLIRSLALAAVLISLPFSIMGVVYNHTANLLLFGFYGLAMVPHMRPTVQRRFQPRTLMPRPSL